MACRDRLKIRNRRQIRSSLRYSRICRTCTRRCPNKLDRCHEHKRSCRIRRTVRWWSNEQDVKWRHHMVQDSTHLRRVGSRCALTFTADASSLTGTEHLGSVVRFALKFQLGIIHVSGTLASATAVLLIARAHTAHLVSSGVAVRRILLKSLN